MKHWSKTRANQHDERGVSPIIATILLVAITVVLAAVLYILVSGFGVNTPPSIAVSMVVSSRGFCDGANEVSIGIGGATATLTTSNFGVSLTPAGAAVGTPPGTAGAKSTSQCGVAAPASGWEALLVSPGGQTQLAYFDSAGWHQWNATTFPVAIAGGQTLLIVANPAINLVGGTVGVYGTNGGPTVSGSASL